MSIDKIRTFLKVTCPFLHMKKGQVSFEYLLIVGFALASVLAIGVFAVFSFQSFSDEVTIKQAKQATELLVNSAELVNSYGKPTFVTQTIFVPGQIDAIFVQANEVTFRVRTSLGLTDVSSFAKVNMTGVISNSIGQKNILITAGDSNVTFS